MERTPTLRVAVQHVRTNVKHMQAAHIRSNQGHHIECQPLFKGQTYNWSVWSICSVCLICFVHVSTMMSFERSYKRIANFRASLESTFLTSMRERHQWWLLPRSTKCRRHDRIDRDSGGSQVNMQDNEWTLDSQCARKLIFETCVRNLVFEYVLDLNIHTLHSSNCSNTFWFLNFKELPN